MRPLAGGNPSRPDLDAAELLDRNEAHRLELVRGRAEKWAGGLTALTGLLGTVLVGKAPQNIRAVATPGRATAGILLAVALAALLFATYRAYQAAYGDPGRLDQLPRQPLTGLAERLTAARYTAAQAAGTHQHRPLHHPLYSRRRQARCGVVRHHSHRPCHRSRCHRRPLPMTY